MVPDEPADERPTPDVPWHELTVDDVAERLGTDRVGLQPDEAAARLEHDGPNEIEEEPPRSRLDLVADQLRSPLIAILVVAAGVTAALGDVVDALVIAAVVALNGVIGYVQEHRAEGAIRSLRQLVTQSAHVLRDGHEREVPARELVVGDVVLLETGQRVPADLRLFAVNALAVDESLLTGESVPVAKSTEAVEAALPADRVDLAYGGTIITTGRGRGWVVATAEDSALGRIAEVIREEESPPSPLQLRMDSLGRLIGLVVVAAAVGTLALGLVRGEDLGEMFAFAVALAVSAVPEGLPVVLTITLALGVRRMAARDAVTRRLVAVETLGSTTVIGTDKTGTLTQNRMTAAVLDQAGVVRPTDDAALVTEVLEDGRPTRSLVIAGVLTSEARLAVVDGERRAEGDPTEVALLALAADLGLPPAAVRGDLPVLGELPFEAERRLSAALVEGRGGARVLVKGAPEQVVELCTAEQTATGLLPIDRSAVAARIDALAAGGHRVLAVAERDDVPTDADLATTVEAGDLVLVGLVGLLDPPRPGVRDAVEGCRGAGIRVLMLTGDHADTARAIAAQVGIAEEGADVVRGVDVDALDDDALRERCRDVDVYARVTPEHKLRVVQALQADGEVVAVTGDGVNDAPALRAAEIGIAMGRGGTDVAREAADMVLVDDDFTSIYAAVEEGRVTFDNVRKVTFYLLSSGVAEVLALLIALVAGWPLLLLPTQILWLNLMTNGLQDVALAFEPGERDVLDHPPRDRSEGVLSRVLWVRTFVVAVVMAAGTLALFRWELDQGGTEAEARTLALTTLVLFQVFHLGNARSERSSAFRIPVLANRFLVAAVVVVVSVQAAVLYVPAMQYVLHVEPLAIDAWGRAVAVASTVVAAGELHKAWVARSRGRSR